MIERFHERARGKSAIVRTVNDGDEPIRVLVVDDSADCADMLIALLELSGYVARASNDGADALRLAAEFRPRVAVLDVGLPGMDGYELARRMKEQVAAPDLILIALTGLSQLETSPRARAAGFAAHLVKPVEVDKITAVIDRLVSRAN